MDLCTQLKADLTVIDGSRVLSTNGPGGPGKVIKQDTIIASDDMVAADACAVASFEWYRKRFKPRQVKHILEAIAVSASGALRLSNRSYKDTAKKAGLHMSLDTSRQPSGGPESQYPGKKGEATDFDPESQDSVAPGFTE